MDLGMYCGFNSVRTVRYRPSGASLALDTHRPSSIVPCAEQNGLTGTLPHELSVLQSMKRLALEDGLISGSIPSQYGDLKALETLDLNFNNITGTLPDSIYTLLQLRQLDLNDNAISGSLSSKLSQLTMLDFLQVHRYGSRRDKQLEDKMEAIFAHPFVQTTVLCRNRMTGTIPTEVGDLANLSVATFESNNFQGSMPTEVCALKVATLTADCLSVSGRGSPPFVVCDCCSQCF
jgi:Leucine-rich repeat (LRR) protein